MLVPLPVHDVARGQDVARADDRARTPTACGTHLSGDPPGKRRVLVQVPLVGVEDRSAHVEVGVAAARRLTHLHPLGVEPDGNAGWHVAVEAPHVEVLADPALVELDDLDHGPVAPNALDSNRHLEAYCFAVGHEVQALLRAALELEERHPDLGCLPLERGQALPLDLLVVERPRRLLVPHRILLSVTPGLSAWRRRRARRDTWLSEKQRWTHDTRPVAFRKGGTTDGGTTSDVMRATHGSRPPVQNGEPPGPALPSIRSRIARGGAASEHGESSSRRDGGVRICVRRPRPARLRSRRCLTHHEVGVPASPR